MYFLRRTFLALAVLTLFLRTTPVRAEQGEIIKELSPTDAERILQAMKIQYRELEPGIYTFSLGGYKTALINKGRNIQFYSSFKKKTSLDRINNWNASKRYTRAYLDKDGDPVLEADLNLAGGVSPATLLEFIAIWIDSMKLFTQHIGFQGATGPSGGGR